MKQASATSARRPDGWGWERLSQGSHLAVHGARNGCIGEVLWVPTPRFFIAVDVRAGGPVVGMRQGAWYDLQDRPSTRVSTSYVGLVLCGCRPSGQGTKAGGMHTGYRFRVHHSAAYCCSVRAPTLNSYIKKSALPENICWIGCASGYVSIAYQQHACANICTGPARSAFTMRLLHTLCVGPRMPARPQTGGRLARSKWQVASKHLSPVAATEKPGRVNTVTRFAPFNLIVRHQRSKLSHANRSNPSCSHHIVAPGRCWYRWVGEG